MKRSGSAMRRFHCESNPVVLGGFQRKYEIIIL
jgi:hypothetical protein